MINCPVLQNINDAHNVACGHGTIGLEGDPSPKLLCKGVGPECLQLWAVAGQVFFMALSRQVDVLVGLLLPTSSKFKKERRLFPIITLITDALNESEVESNFLKSSGCNQDNIELIMENEAKKG